MTNIPDGLKVVIKKKKFNKYVYTHTYIYIYIYI